MNGVTASSSVKLPAHDRTAWLRGGRSLCQMPPRIPAGAPWRLVLLGAPGVGKGTQAELLRDRFGACHLSTGDIFRTAKCQHEQERTASMREALDFMRRGALVPDETVLGLIAERIRCLRCSGGFLLDGFPRTVAQAEALEKLLTLENIPLDAVIDYEMPLDQIISRISGRRTCPKCKAVFHVLTQPPRQTGACDHCGTKLIQREDDRPESVEIRMQAYERSTRPLIEFYSQRGLLRTVSATGRPEEIFQRVTLSLLAGLKLG